MYVRDNLTEEELLHVKKLAVDTLGRMNDRQFTSWLLANWGYGGETVEIGVVTSDNTLWGFRTKDVYKEISDAIEQRMGARRIQSNMIVVEVPEGIQGFNPLAAMQQFLHEFSNYAAKGPKEPKLCSFKRDSIPTLEKDWLEWYRSIYSVDTTTAWQAGAERVAKELNREEKDWAWYPAEVNNLEIIFVRKLAEIRI
jgi:hypothetical protein